MTNPFNLSKTRRERRAYWRSLPLSRLYFLQLAVFFTFGNIGLLNGILSATRTPVIIGLGLAVVTGATSVCYALAFARKPLLFPLVAIVQLTVNTIYAQWSARLLARGWVQLSPEHTTIAIFAVGAMLFVLLGYMFFLAFISKEGKQIIRTQAELSLAHGIQQTLVPRLTSGLRDARSTESPCQAKR